MIVRREEERLLTGIVKQLHLLRRQSLRLILPALLASRLMQCSQSRRQTRIVVQIGPRTLHALTPRTHQLPGRILQLVQQKPGCPLRQLQITRSIRQTTAGRQRLNHQRVPFRQHLVVQKWPRASTSALQQLRSRCTQPLANTRLLPRQIQNATMLEILRLAKPVHPQKFVRLRTQHLPNLRFRPHIKLALDRVRFCIQSRTEAAVRQRHFASQKAHQFVHHLLIQRIGFHLQCLGIHLQQLRLVVQHLLKMRHRPRSLGTVPMKTATQMVADPALRHRRQRIADHIPQCLLARLTVQAEQKSEPGHVRKPRAIRPTRIEIDSAPRRVILPLNAF